MEKINTPLGERIKRYEEVTRQKLLPHVPTIIRIDGKAFHTYTKAIKANKPFCTNLHMAMLHAARCLVEGVVQNAVLGYVQSDECSILLKDWPNLNTEQWFNGGVQKICSVSASAFTHYFNNTISLNGDSRGALFDARVFQLPLCEVTNYFIWRQQDFTRNSVQMLGRHYFSHKELKDLSCEQIQDKLIHIHDVNWNSLETWKRRGSCIYKFNGEIIVNLNIPIFTQDRTFIEQFIEDEITHDKTPQ